jgi:hypothetical protein
MDILRTSHGRAKRPVPAAPADGDGDLWSQVRAELDAHMPPDVADRTAATIRLWAEILAGDRSRVAPGVREMELGYARAAYEGRHGIKPAPADDGPTVPTARSGTDGVPE